jgi:hypothetical protein
MAVLTWARTFQSASAAIGVSVFAPVPMRTPRYRRPTSAIQVCGRAPRNSRTAGTRPRPRPKKLVGQQQTLALTAGDEGRFLECRVTATNKWGSTNAFSNGYKVNVGAPRVKGRAERDRHHQFTRL